MVLLDDQHHVLDVRVPAGAASAVLRARTRGVAAAAVGVIARDVDAVATAVGLASRARWASSSIGRAMVPGVRRPAAAQHR